MPDHTFPVLVSTNWASLPPVHQLRTIRPTVRQLVTWKKGVRYIMRYMLKLKTHISRWLSVLNILWRNIKFVGRKRICKRTRLFKCTAQMHRNWLQNFARHDQKELLKGMHARILKIIYTYYNIIRNWTKDSGERKINWVYRMYNISGNVV